MNANLAAVLYLVAGILFILSLRCYLHGMLLTINRKTHFAERKRTDRLQTFGLDERGLQDILFKSLDRLFPDDELILLMQSRRWQEERRAAVGRGAKIQRWSAP